MEDKRHIDHQEEGRAHRYRAVVGIEDARASALTHTLDRMFGGSAQALVAQLVLYQGLSKKDLKGIRRVAKERLELKRLEKRARK
jgi:predicted transcriptional regulator